MDFCIKKIIFLGDLLRTYNLPRSAIPADGLIRHCFYLFSKQIEEITRLPVEYEISGCPNLFDRTIFYKICGKTLCQDSWLEIFSEPVHNEGVEYFKECFKDCFLIFQEAGSLRKYADSANIPYIDMFISSIRFTEDLNYALRTNIDIIRNVLLNYRIPEISFYCQANLLKSYYNLRKNPLLEDNSCLLCGQTEIDLSVIKDNKFYTLLDVIDKIKDLCKEYNTIYYIRHPNSNPKSKVEKEIMQLPFIKKIDANIYQLLTNPKIKGVAALSSSVLKEAKYFNKKCHILLHPYIQYFDGSNDLSKDKYITVTHDCFSTIFWSNIFSTVIKVYDCDYYSFGNSPNFLRKLTNGYQGYRADDILNFFLDLKNNNKLKDRDKVINEILDFIYISKNYSNLKKFYLYYLDKYFYLIYHITKQKKYLASYYKNIGKIAKAKISKRENLYSNITVVLQGSTLQKFNGFRCVEHSVASIRKYMPDCKIILSTWEGEDIPSNLLIDKIIFNKDPGYYTRDCTENGKKNNVNRQIVSTLAGLKEVKTGYALKLRTDFVLTGTNFIKELNRYRKCDDNYRIFERKIVCSMFDTRKPYGVYYNLPFHVGDFFFFGLTKDLIKLFDIPLVTKEEFTWFVDHTEFQPDTFAKNKFGGEQSIWIGCLKSNGKKVDCEYSTHINPSIAEESDKFLVNNFVPYSFKRACILPLKEGLRAESKFLTYCDNYTHLEWVALYKKYLDNNIKLPCRDKEANFIKFSLKISKLKLINKYFKSFIMRILKYRAKKLFDK